MNRDNASAVPCSFLLGRGTKIVKVKQGSGFLMAKLLTTFLRNKVILFVSQSASMASIAGTNFVLF
jgi:hypothetical protein